VRERRSWVGNFPGVDKVINFRKRAQRFEERAATAIDPQAREHWQRVADAWYRAAQAAERTPPLIWQWERERWRDLAEPSFPAPIFLGLALQPWRGAGFWRFTLCRLAFQSGRSDDSMLAARS
jgi:hypothetical protein